MAATTVSTVVSASSLWAFVSETFRVSRHAETELFPNPFVAVNFCAEAATSLPGSLHISPLSPLSTARTPIWPTAGKGFIRILPSVSIAVILSEVSVRFFLKP